MQLQKTATETPVCTEFGALIREITDTVMLPDGLVRAVFAVILSSWLRISPPLWLLIVGVPSSGKTEIVSLFRGLSRVYFLDSMTQNPFSSGYKAQKGERTYDLLPLLNDKCLIIKDMTTLFSLNEDTVKKLLGEMTSIFDGIFEKFSPTRGHVAYSSLFSTIGCITPSALNQHQRYLSMIGPRFVFFRIPRLTDEVKSRGFAVAWNKNSRVRVMKSLLEKSQAYIASVINKSPDLFEITEKETQETLDRLAEFMASSRGVVISQPYTFKNDDGKEITAYDVQEVQCEEPWRAHHQLKNLAICMALIDGRDHLIPEDLEILKYIVLSSMPVERAEVLDFVIRNPDVSAGDLSEKIDKSRRTCQRLLKELEALGIITADLSLWQGVAKHYHLKPQYSLLLLGKTTTTPEFLSHLFPDKPVQEYTNDELRTCRETVRIHLKELSAKDMALANERMGPIENELRNRRAYPEGQFPVADQLIICETEFDELPFS